MKPVLLMSLLLLTAASAQAGDADLRRCRDIADGTLRLACYDALTLSPQTPGAAGPAAAAMPSGPTALPAPATPAGAVPAATGVAAVAAAPATTEASFGLKRRADELPEITSHIPGHFDGWSRNKRIRLANGQLWLVIDDGRAYVDLQDPKVTVRRAALGSFMMEIEGASGTPRVRRIE